MHTPRTLVILSNDYPSSIPGSEEVPSGGTARFARDFSQAVAASGNTWVGVLRYTKEQTIDNGNIKHATILKNTESTNSFLLLEEYIDPYEYFAADILRIVHIIHEFKVTSVFLNGAYTFTWILYAAAKKAGIPCITQHAGVFAVEVQYRPSGFSPMGVKQSLKMVQEIAEYSSHNIFLNEFSYEKFKELSMGIIHNPIVIPLPYGDGKYPNHFSVKNSETLHIGCVARWDAIKNHEAIVSLAEEIHTQQLPWHLSVVTSIPPTPIKAELKKHYGEVVSLIEPMSTDMLMQYYAKNDIMILPSHFDVSPTVVLEALQAGVPTLISKTVGWRSEYEAAGMNEWIADFSDTKHCIEQIKKIHARKEWSEVGGFAKMAGERHESDAIYAKYLTLFS